MFDTVFVKTDGRAWMNLYIPHVGKVNHEFQLPPEFHKALLDYCYAQADLKVADIQANMTAKHNNNGGE